MSMIATFTATGYALTHAPARIPHPRWERGEWRDRATGKPVPPPRLAEVWEVRVVPHPNPRKADVGVNVLIPVRYITTAPIRSFLHDDGAVYCDIYDDKTRSYRRVLIVSADGHVAKEQTA